MKTIDAAGVDRADLDLLDDAVRTMPPDSELAFFLAAIAAAIRGGQDVIAGKESDLVTPAQAAKMLGVSRVHLYKVMDAGDLPFVQVGRDRRIELGNVKQLLAARDDASKALAERFARSTSLREEALKLI